MHSRHNEFTMNQINLQALKIVDAIIQHKTAGKAAQELGISSSSISYTLKKLRQQLGNPIFIRARHRLLPDEHALALQKKYHEIAALSEERRELIIATYTPVELLIGLQPNIMQSADGPPLTFTRMPDCVETRMKNLRNRAVDIDIGGQLPDNNAIVCYPYLQSSFRVLAGKNHSTIKDSFTEKEWFENDHIAWLRGAGSAVNVVQGTDTGHEMFMGRKVTSSSSSLMAMANLCASSDTLMLIPEVFAAAFEQVYPVKTFALPWSVPLQFNCYLHFHREVGRNASAVKILRLFDSKF